jgi:hypothetical protein
LFRTAVSEGLLRHFKKAPFLVNLNLPTSNSHRPLVSLERQRLPAETHPKLPCLPDLLISCIQGFNQLELAYLIGPFGLRFTDPDANGDRCPALDVGRVFICPQETN